VPSTTALDRVVDLLSQDDTLIAEVADIHDRAEFCAAVRAIAANHGIDVTDEQIVTGLREARTAWLARWV